MVEYLKSISVDKVVIKDPSAIFSTEWLSSTFNMDVVILVRHPAAVVNSYKQLGWSHPFSHFLNQPELVDRYLKEFKDEIEYFAETENSIVDQIAFLWKLVYCAAKKLRAAHENWIFVRYEDFTIDPINAFRDIFRRLGLVFTESIKRQIVRNSHHSNPTSSKNPYSITRNSKGITQKWKTMLTKSEINRIRTVVEDVSGDYYGDRDW